MRKSILKRGLLEFASPKSKLKRAYPGQRTKSTFKAKKKHAPPHELIPDFLAAGAAVGAALTGVAELHNGVAEQHMCVARVRREQLAAGGRSNRGEASERVRTFRAVENVELRGRLETSGVGEPACRARKATLRAHERDVDAAAGLHGKTRRSVNP
eukprot:6185632-Pleurochrysis_carterae.AAC.4